MRLALTLMIFGALAACNSVVSDNGPAVKRLTVADTKTTTDTTTQATAAATAETPATDKTAADKPAAEVAALEINNNNPAISDTQDFSAVTKRLSIKADKARLKAQREKFQVIAPKALPKRGAKEVNVVEYALTTTNAVGEAIYKRSTLFAATMNKRNCAKFTSSDDAQLVFLKSGGPKRDVKSLDPDGDGFACDWSPETYRKAAQ